MVSYRKNDSFSEIRKRAQEFLTGKPSVTEITHDDLQKLVHELDTYQVELELQNEDLRTAQEELERSRSRYATLYDFAPIAYMTVSAKGMILEANLASAKLLGISRGELLNRPFSNFIFPDDQDIFYLHRKKLLKHRQQQSFELRLQPKNGSLFYGQLETVLQPEGCAPPDQFLLMVSDLSPRRKAELKKLREVKNRYRTIVMDQNELICRFYPKGEISFVNDAFCRFFRVNYREVLGTKFRPDIHADDVPLLRDQFKQLTPDKPAKNIEYRVHLNGGRVAWLQWCCRAIFDANGNTLKYQAVGRDITQQKETEEQLRKVLHLRQIFLDALPCIAMLTKHDSHLIVSSNKAAIAAGAVPGKTCYSTWEKRESPCPWCRAQIVYKEKIPQNTQFWANGTYWDAYWVPLQDGLYLHYLFDITEKQKIKDALIQAHNELEQRVRERTLELQQSHEQLLHSEKLGAIGNLSASIAHEFNNPLQSVMTIIKGIEQYVPMAEKEKELIALALQECQRMKRLIADLRDFSRPSSDKREELDLHVTLDALLLLTKKDFLNRHITIVKEYANTLQPVMAVSDQLKQVFLNLLNNAADACNDGGVITISTEAVEGGRVIVHIEDNGIGIPSQNLNQLFEPFFTTKPEIKGTGLGLSVSYGIIKKHSGSIEVQSEAGKGTKFSVILPIDGDQNEQQINTAG